MVTFQTCGTNVIWNQRINDIHLETFHFSGGGGGGGGGGGQDLLSPILDPPM